MKKKLIALLAAVCMMAAPIGVMAEETDYSYLEDMSVKELRALRDAINELLGDEEGTGEDNTEETEEVEITEEEEWAVEAITLYTNNLINPHSLKLYKVYVKIDDPFESDGRVVQNYALQFNVSGTNSYGADIESKEHINIYVEEDESFKDALYEQFSWRGTNIFHDGEDYVDFLSIYTELDVEKIYNEVMKRI